MTGGLMLGAVALASAAGWLAARPGRARAPRRQARPSRARPVPVLIAAGVAAGVWAVLGGWIGWGLAPVAGVAAHRWARARPTGRQRRAAQQAHEELPHLVALLGAQLRAGVDPVRGLAECCHALPGPAAERLAPTLSQARLGAPAAAWHELSRDEVLGTLGRVLARTHATGASVADAVDTLADDLAAQVHATAEDRARRVGVLAAVPLGLCLLPAFMVLGILPVVASLLADLLP